MRPPKAQSPKPKARYVRLSALVCGLLVFVITGCDPGREQETPATPDQPAPPTNPVPTKAEPVGEAVDLTADKPEAKAADAKTKILLDDIQPEGPLNQTARKVYGLVQETKEQAEFISKDLDEGGKQISKLIRASDQLCKSITLLADVWPENKPFRDLCIDAKRNALILNDELSRVPRTWSHVRWALSGTLKSVSTLRLRARDLAEAEPKPVPLLAKNGKPVLDKDGKIIYVEVATPADAAIARREEITNKAQRMRNQLRKEEEESKKKPMQTELDR
ncbi:MAG TPA: hypothetical protein VGP72_29145 [Planctomycetota bacterium]|jgi:hypothetical protein